MEPTTRRARRHTATKQAAALGVSPRTIRRHVALARADYLAGAAERRSRAGALAAEGASWREIAEALGCSPAAARALAWRAGR